MPDRPARPAALRDGDLLGVAAPCSPPHDPDALARGLRRLRASAETRGVGVAPGRSFEAHTTPHGYLAGPDEDRLAELNGFFRRDDVSIVACVRGGYGAMRLLPHLDYEAARRRPTLVVGYSDVTALHLALWKRARVPGLHGPMVASDWPTLTDATERLFWPWVEGRGDGLVLGPKEEVLAPLRPGTAEGTLLGGNLSMLVRLLGTPFLPDLSGAILFVEDIGEAPYRLDALFAQLDMAGLLDGIGGLLLGAFTDWETSGKPTFTPEQVVAHYTQHRPYPVATGLRYGHFVEKTSLPVGVPARLEVTDETAELTVLASPTA